MDGYDEARRFEANRGHLRGVAFRMLGSLSEAEDAVQEAWLRFSRADTSGVENLGGWLKPLIWLARKCTSSSVRGGTPALATDAPSACKACMASGATIAGFFILDSTIALLTTLTNREKRM